jgi:hypothetical protein
MGEVKSGCGLCGFPYSFRKGINAALRITMRVCAKTGIALLTAAVLAAPALAQLVPNNGPPIPADQVFRSQPTTVTPAPKSLPGPPPLTFKSQSDYRATPPATPDVDVSRDRVADCQHQAAARGVRKSKRAAYVHTCAYGR